MAPPARTRHKVIHISEPLKSRNPALFCYTVSMARFTTRPSRGFTLIELLVVISIIGLLSSVVLAALAGARTKGKEGVIIGDMIQMRNLYEAAYATKGNYSDLQPTTPNASGCVYYDGATTGYLCSSTVAANNCSTIFSTNITSSYAPQALTLCNQIVSMAGNFYIGQATTSPQTYSIWALLPSQNKFMCFGSGKNNSATSSLVTYGQAGSVSPGCPGNP